MSDEQNSQDPLRWQQLEFWLLLFHVSGLGPTRFKNLLNHFGTPEAILAAGLSELAQHVPERLARRIRMSASDAFVQALVRQDRLWLGSGHGQHHIIALNDPRYPLLLKAIHDPPPLLYVRGDVCALSDRQLAVVGCRQATRQASEVARQISHELAAAGLIITSGMAIGIDGSAHKGALEGGGRTIAVLACGVDVVYPQRHRGLADAISAQGALVSEFALGTQPRAGHFPRRNRIISGLSMGTLVVEATVASGSMITARFALEQGRDVFAMPGSVNNLKARGCHALIRDGACLIENAGQLLDELAGVNATAQGLERIRQGEIREPECPEQKRIIDAVGFDACHHDELIIATGLSSQKLAELLLIMELEGFIRSGPFGVTRIC